MPQFHIPKQLGERFELLRGAIRDRQRFTSSTPTSRKSSASAALRPLSLYFWASTGRSRRGARHATTFAAFRIDLVIRLRVTDDVR